MTLYVTFLVKQHIEPGENILTHSDQLFLVSPVPPCFHCIHGHQQCFSVFVWPPCWPNQSGYIRYGIHIPLPYAGPILDAIILLYIRFIVCLLIIIALILIIQVTIPVKPILGVGNASRCNILFTFSWMTVDSSDSADIKYLSSSFRKVLCRQTWWHRWSFWQFKCSRTFILKFWPGYFDDLLCIWNVTNGCH